MGVPVCTCALAEKILHLLWKFKNNRLLWRKSGEEFSYSKIEILKFGNYTLNLNYLEKFGSADGELALICISYFKEVKFISSHDMSTSSYF